jgi:hypothetical protein
MNLSIHATKKNTLYQIANFQVEQLEWSLFLESETLSTQSCCISSLRCLILSASVISTSRSVTGLSTGLPPMLFDAGIFLFCDLLLDERFFFSVSVAAALMSDFRVVYFRLRMRRRYHMHAPMQNRIMPENKRTGPGIFQ